MHTFTALFDRRADAEALQTRLEQLGIIDLDHDVYDRETTGLGDPSTSADTALWDRTLGAVPPKEDRRIYEEAVRRGGFLLTVHVDDQEAGKVHELLEGSNAVDFEEKGRELEAPGFPVNVREGGEEVIPLLEDELRVGKREVERGGVRVRAYTVETPVREEVRLREERVSIERRPANTKVEGGDAFQERDIAMNAIAEEAVVAKDARVVEEVAVRKDVEQRIETIHDTVRRTDVEIARTPSGS